MRGHLIASILALAVSVPTTVMAGYKGPHPVMQYHGNEYAVVINPASDGKSLVVYRAVGSLWERVGGTIINAGQRKSNGSITQNVWFKGRKISTIRGDLRKPFYRQYKNHGAIDY